MHLDYEQEPEAGQQFAFRLVGVVGAVRLHYFVGERPYGEEVCEVPSCAFVVAVPAGTGGEFLRLVVEGEDGSQEFRVRIE
jgi:hypothetical protein